MARRGDWSPQESPHHLLAPQRGGGGGSGGRPASQPRPLLHPRGDAQDEGEGAAGRHPTGRPREAAERLGLVCSARAHACVCLHV